MQIKNPNSLAQYIMCTYKLSRETARVAPLFSRTKKKKKSIKNATAFAYYTSRNSAQHPNLSQHYSVSICPESPLAWPFPPQRLTKYALSTFAPHLSSKPFPHLAVGNKATWNPSPQCTPPPTRLATFNPCSTCSQLVSTPSNTSSTRQSLPSALSAILSKPSPMRSTPLSNHTARRIYSCRG